MFFLQVQVQVSTGAFDFGFITKAMQLSLLMYSKMALATKPPTMVTLPVLGPWQKAEFPKFFFNYHWEADGCLGCIAVNGDQSVGSVQAQTGHVALARRCN